MDEEKVQDLIAHRLVSASDGGNDVEIGTDENLANDHDAPVLVMKAEPPKREEASSMVTTITPTFTKVEKSLASLGFFTPSSRRIKDQKVKHISFTREIEGKRVEVSADIIPSAVFGLPVTADQDKWLGLQQIVTDVLRSEGKISNPIRFKSAQLLRLLNDSTKSGKNYKEVSDWLDVMMSTTIISNGVVYAANQKRFVRDRFKVFERAVSVGKELDDGTVADANYVWLSEWQLQNINQTFLLPIDLVTYRELKNHIAKALVPHLQIWLFASMKTGSFEKRYDELCELFTLQKYRAPSLILRQLKPSLDELTHHGYLAKWRIEKTSDRRAYKVVFFHGEKFHRDRRRRLEQKAKTEAPMVVAESESAEPNLPEPGRLNGATKSARVERGTLVEKEERGRSGKEELIDELVSRGIVPSAAMKLLGEFDPEQLTRAHDWIEYWDGLRKTKDVGTGLLYELIKNGDPLPISFESRSRRAERQAAEDRRLNQGRAQEMLKSRYEEYRRQAVARFMADQLPPEDFERRVEAYKAEMLSQPGFWNERPEMADQFARHAIRAEIAKEANLLSEEAFRHKELPAIASELDLDPTELDLDAGPPGPLAAPAGDGQSSSTHQNALNEPISDVQPQGGPLPIPDQNSSSEAV